MDSVQRDHCGRKHSKDETEHLGGLEDHGEGKSFQGVRVDSGQGQLWRKTFSRAESEQKQLWRKAFSRAESGQKT